MTGQSGTSFTTDRAGASLLAVALSSGQMTIPTGTYFSGSLSITVWAYVLSFTAWSERVVDCGTATLDQANVIFALQRDLTTYSYFEVHNSGSASNTQATSSIPLNTWVFLAATLAGSSANIWYNAVSQASATFSVTVPAYSRTQCYIGHSNYGGSDANVNAYYDDLMFFNTGLSQSQLLTVKNAYLPN